MQLYPGLIDKVCTVESRLAELIGRCNCSYQRIFYTIEYDLFNFATKEDEYRTCEITTVIYNSVKNI